MKKFLATITLILSGFMLVACNNIKSDKFEVVASTTMLGDLVNQIGGDHVNVTLLFGPGIDPHLAIPTGGDTRVIQNADLVLFNGLDLEAHYDVILNAYKDKTIEVGSKLDALDILTYEEANNLIADPHFWFSVPLWIKAARIIGDELKLRNPENANDYESNTLSYIEKLTQLHEWVISSTEELNKEQRVLVTAHDAFQYFADTYDFKVYSIGGISTQGEPTPNDIRNTASIIINNNVKAIFIESSVPKRTVESVIDEVKSRGRTVSIGNELYSDSLGIGGDSNYINALMRNVNNIVSALK